MFSTNQFQLGFDVNECQGEEYKVNATTNQSQGWLFDNFITSFTTQLKDFISYNDDGDYLFLIDLISRWNELRGSVLSDENVLYRLDYYYYYFLKIFLLIMKLII